MAVPSFRGERGRADLLGAHRRGESERSWVAVVLAKCPVWEGAYYLPPSECGCFPSSGGCVCIITEALNPKRWGEPAGCPSISSLPTGPAREIAGTQTEARVRLTSYCEKCHLGLVPCGRWWLGEEQWESLGLGVLEEERRD